MKMTAKTKGIYIYKVNKTGRGSKGKKELDIVSKENGANSVR